MHRVNNLSLKIKKKRRKEMARTRETPCKSYVCKGECAKGRDADHNGYCQKCNKYEPRARIRHLNKKKQKLDKIRSKEFD